MSEWEGPVALETDEVSLGKVVRRTRATLTQAEHGAGEDEKVLRQTLDWALRPVAELDDFLSPARAPSKSRHDYDPTQATPEETDRERTAVARLIESLEDVAHPVADLPRVSDPVRRAVLVVQVRDATRALVERTAEYARGRQAVVPTAARTEHERRRLVGFARNLEKAVVRAGPPARRGDETREVITFLASENLGDHYRDYAQREAGTASRMRVGAVACALAVSVLAALWLATAVAQPSAAQLAGHVLIGLPIAALATYFGRESSRHRANATWAEEIEVQLRTLDAYALPLTEAQRDKLRAQFGTRVFGARTPEPAAEDALNAPGAVQEVLQFAREVLQMANGRPGPGAEN